MDPKYSPPHLIQWRILFTSGARTCKESSREWSQLVNGPIFVTVFLAEKLLSTQISWTNPRRNPLASSLLFPAENHLNMLSFGTTETSLSVMRYQMHCNILKFVQSRNLWPLQLKFEQSTFPCIDQ